MSIEDDISAVRAGRGTPDQQMTVVSVLDALLRPSEARTDGILPDPMAGRENAFYDPPARECRCYPGCWVSITGKPVPDGLQCRVGND